MICRQCGKTVLDDSLFCQYCGAHFEDSLEDACVEIEAESSPKAYGPEPIAVGNVRYCQKCGGVVDPETKKCTKCGKQYFKFPTRAVVRGLVAALIIAMGVGLVYLYNQNQALEERIIKTTETQPTEMTSLEELALIAFGVDNASDKDYEYSFYHDHAVLVQEGDPCFHHYGCEVLDSSQFWIYNVEAAKGLGYKACPECQSVNED